MLVDIIAEEDKQSRKITRGYIAEIISKENSSKGIKVRLTNGKKGVVQYVPTKDDIRLENFKFYNRFFFHPTIYSIWDNQARKYLVIEHYNRSIGQTEKTAFLFDSKEKAKELIKGSVYDSKDYSIRLINRKKPIVENFKTLEIDYFRINKERKLSFERLKEWEHYFKNMR